MIEKVGEPVAGEQEFEQFTECSACKDKPGCPVLCNECYARRDAVDSRNRAAKDARALEAPRLSQDQDAAHDRARQAQAQEQSAKPLTSIYDMINRAEQMRESVPKLEARIVELESRLRAQQEATDGGRLEAAREKIKMLTENEEVLRTGIYRSLSRANRLVLEIQEHEHARSVLQCKLNRADVIVKPALVWAQAYDTRVTLLENNKPSADLRSAIKMHEEI